MRHADCSRNVPLSEGLRAASIENHEAAFTVLEVVIDIRRVGLIRRLGLKVIHGILRLRSSPLANAGDEPYLGFSSRHYFHLVDRNLLITSMRYKLVVG